MKIGISGQLLGNDRSLEEILRLLKKYCVENIEIWPCNISGETEGAKLCDDTYEGRDTAKAKRLLDSYGIKTCCVTMPAAYNPEISGDPNKYTAELIRAIKIAKEFGANLVNHYCYGICMDERPNLQRIKEYLLPALKTAEDEGVTLCLENEAHDATRAPEGMLEILEGFNSRYFMTNFDATNYCHASQEGFPYAYEVLKKYIAYVHIKNGCVYSIYGEHNPESKGAAMSGHYAPNAIYYPYAGDGAVNIDGLLRRLKHDGYDGYCVLEPHTAPKFAEDYYENDLEYLKRRI